MNHRPHTANPPQRIAVSGASGLVGSALCAALRERGDTVCPIVRCAKGIPGEIVWDTRAQTFDAHALADCDAVVHLAGENIVGRWTAKRKREVRDSRVNGTRALCETLAKLGGEPRTLIAASAIGYYGDTGQSEARSEDDPPGEDYLASVCTDWERAAAPAVDAGLRVVHLRIGIVLSKEGGALTKMLLPFKLGLGGRIGAGTQWMSWVSMTDMVRILFFALDTHELSGPLNAVAPEAVTQGQFAKTLGKALHRPAVLPLPGFVPRMMFGKEAAQALVLGSLRVAPKRLLEAGFVFEHAGLEVALRDEITGA